MKPARRPERAGMLLAVVIAFACSAHDLLKSSSRNFALDRTQPLPAPANTIVATETNGTQYRYGGHDTLTDDLAPMPGMSVTADGALSLHLPILVPPGRAGLEPSLSLDYNSRGGSSLTANVGFGWQLSGLPTIQRCPRSAADSGPGGKSSAIMFDDSVDQLCLDGEPLVPEIPGTPISQNGAAFRTLHDDHRRFIIGIDPSFGIATITAYGRDGRVTTWGQTSGSALGGFLASQRYSFSITGTGYQGITATLSPDAKRYAWLLATVTDRSHNEIDYSWYQFSCPNGNDSLFGNAASVAPAQIDYTKNTGSSLSATKHIIFSYNSIGCSQPPGENPVYVSGIKVNPSMRMLGLQITGPNADASATVTIRQYRFYYNDAATAPFPSYYARSTLSDFVECDGAGTCKPGLHFWYGEDAPLDGEWTDVGTDVQANPINDVRSADPLTITTWPPRIYTPDVNKDGRDDVVYMAANSSNYVTRFSLGTATSPQLSSTNTSGPSSLIYDSRLFPNDLSGVGFATGLLGTEGGNTVGYNGGAVMFQYDPTSTQFQTNANVNLTGTTAGEMADIDGDGLADLVESTSPLLVNGSYSNTLGWDYRINNGTGGLTGGSQQLLQTGPNDHLLIDVDGDGSAEILSVLPSPNDSTRYTAQHAGRTPWSGIISPTTLDFNPARPYTFADLNGDGLTDAIGLGMQAGDQRIFIRMNTGNGFFYPIILTPTPQNAWGDSFVARVIDFNNDGRQDILFRQKTSSLGVHAPLYVLWFDGWNFQVTNLPSTAYSVLDPGYGSNETPMFEVLDVNGDGLDDIAMVNYPGSFTSTPSELHLFVRTGSGKRNRHLQRIDRTGVTRGQTRIPGEEYDITYKPISDSSVYGNNDGDLCHLLAYPERCVDGKLWVVANISRWDDAHSTSSPYNQLNYTYTDARADMRGRGFLGFRTITANQVEKGITTQTTYDLLQKENTQSFYPLAGVPIQVYTTTSYTRMDGTTASWARTEALTLTTVHTAGASFFVYPGTSTDSVVETYSDGTTATLYTNTTTQTVDPKGTLTLLSTSRDDGSSDSVTHTPTYVDDGTWPEITVDQQTETSATAAAGSLSRSKTLNFDANWNLQSVTSLPSGNDRGEQTLITTYTRTPEGLPQTVTVAETAGRGGASRQLSYTYDSYEHAFPSVLTDSLGHIQRTAYHPSFGLVAIDEDENGLQSVYQYDGLGRSRNAAFATGESNSFSYVSPPSDPYAPIGGDTLVRVLMQEGTGAKAVGEMNWRGKATIRRTWSRPDGLPVYESFIYDNQDRLQGYYPPALSLQGSTGRLAIAYDSLDRMTEVDQPDSSRWTYLYSGLQTKVVDTNDNYALNGLVTHDSQGRTIQTKETYFLGYFHTILTNYTYGPFGTPYQTSFGGNVTTRETNRLGQLWHSNDPDTGDRHYYYNAFGDVETETTPQYTTTDSYDSVGRLRTQTTGSRINSLTYDTATNGIGKLAQIVSPDHVTTQYGYDARGHLSSQTWTIGSEQFVIGASFDSFGRLDTATYPSAGGQSVSAKYLYDASSGALTSIRDVQGNVPYWTYQSSDASGKFTTELFGNGVTSSRTESSTNPTTLGRIQVTNPGGLLIRDVSYMIDGRQNLTGRTNNLAGTSETFGYDALGRLSTWTWKQGTTVMQGVRYAYNDGTGSMTARNVTAGNGSSVSFTFNTSVAGPHQPVSSTLGNYVYDTNGRQTSAPGRTVSYTEFDLPSVITGGSDSYQFAYDGEQNRVLKQRSNGDTTISLGDLYERQIRTGTATHVYTFLGPRGPVAVLKISNGVTTKFYLHADHLGSIELITDSNGNVQDQLAYDPFGARMQPSPPQVLGGLPQSGIDSGFTNHRHDDEASLGLVNMNGRVYDPTIARFISGDPVAPRIGSQWLDPYAYVRQNPLTWSDPSGFDPPAPPPREFEPSGDKFKFMGDPPPPEWRDREEKDKKEDTPPPPPKTPPRANFDGRDPATNASSGQVAPGPHGSAWLHDAAVGAATHLGATFLNDSLARSRYVRGAAALAAGDGQARSALKAATRQQTSLFGRQVAEQMRPAALEAARTGGTAFKTNLGVNRWMRASGYVGTVGLLFGLGFAIYHIWVAPPEERMAVLAHESGSMLGGLFGGSVGTLEGFEIGLYVGSYFGPAGMLIGGIIGGISGMVIGGGVGGAIGGQAADRVYDAVDR